MATLPLKIGSVEDLKEIRLAHDVLKAKTDRYEQEIHQIDRYSEILEKAKGAGKGPFGNDKAAAEAAAASCGMHTVQTRTERRVIQPDTGRDVTQAYLNAHGHLPASSHVVEVEVHLVEDSEPAAGEIKAVTVNPAIATEARAVAAAQVQTTYQDDDRKITNRLAQEIRVWVTLHLLHSQITAYYYEAGYNRKRRGNGHSQSVYISA